jgi:hypothetical protein
MLTRRTADLEVENGALRQRVAELERLVVRDGPGTVRPTRRSLTTPQPSDPSTLSTTLRRGRSRARLRSITAEAPRHRRRSAPAPPRSQVDTLWLATTAKESTKSDGRGCHYQSRITE